MRFTISWGFKRLRQIPVQEEKMGGNSSKAAKDPEHKITSYEPLYVQVPELERRLREIHTLMGLQENCNY